MQALLLRRSGGGTSIPLCTRDLGLQIPNVGLQEAVQSILSAIMQSIAAVGSAILLVAGVRKVDSVVVRSILDTRRYGNARHRRVSSSHPSR